MRERQRISRLNFATVPERVAEAVERMASFRAAGAVSLRT
jgi:hypothetical protein